MIGCREGCGGGEACTSGSRPAPSREWSNQVATRTKCTTGKGCPSCLHPWCTPGRNSRSQTACAGQPVHAWECGGRALGVGGAHGAGCGRARCGVREGALVQLALLTILGSAFAHRRARSVTGVNQLPKYGRHSAPRRTGALATRGPGELSLQVDPGTGVSAAAERSSANLAIHFVRSAYVLSRYCGVAECESAMRYCIRREKKGEGKLEGGIWE